MNFSDERKFRRWFIIFSAISLIILIVWNAVIFFQRLKEDERKKMNIWAAAQVSLDQADDNTDL
ncbi:two-component sensor histidine kinase, partial [Flavobacterium sp. IR1]